MVQEDYKTFVQICRKPGVYVDKYTNYLLKVTATEVMKKGRDGKRWDRYVMNVSNPNKARFLSYSARQASIK